MEKKFSSVAMVVALFLMMAGSLQAIEYKVVVPKLSPVSTDAYTALIKAIIDATGNKADIQVQPFARCVYLVETKQVDIVSTEVAVPDKAKAASQKFDYSAAETNQITFVLYTNKNKRLSVDELKKGNPKGYKIETDLAHVNHFSFALIGSTSIEASLKKVDAGQIDGYIFSQGSGDSALKAAGLKNIFRQPYDIYSGRFLLQKGTAAGSVDKMLSEGLAKIKASGQYAQILEKVNAAAATYIDWQP